MPLRSISRKPRDWPAPFVVCWLTKAFRKRCVKTAGRKSKTCRGIELQLKSKTYIMNSLNQKSVHNLVLYFQVHQPVRLRPYRFFDIGLSDDYFDDDQNLTIMHRVARQCYLPANKVISKIIRKYPQVKVAFSISGVTLQQMKAYAGDVLDSFAELA